MKKYFAISDIHSNFTAMETALKEAQFDINNADHVLIVCGDVFDRCTGTLAVYNFLKGLPNDRLILIRGNHEDLYLDLLKKDFPDNYDFSNGTVKTFCHIAGIKESALSLKDIAIDKYYSKGLEPDFPYLRRQIMKTWQDICDSVECHEITQWLKSDIWVNYAEIDKYILTHCFIPLRSKFSGSMYDPYYTEPDILENITDWRTESEELDWRNSRWGVPFSLFDAGLFDIEKNKGKSLICGHFSARAFHDHYRNKPYDDSIYIGDNLIALDGCTIISNKCNVFTFDAE